MTARTFVLGSGGVVFPGVLLLGVVGPPVPGAEALASTMGTALGAVLVQVPSTLLLAWLTTHLSLVAGLVAGWYLVQIMIHRSRRGTVGERALRAYRRGQRVRLS